MKLLAVVMTAIIIAGIGSCNRAHAQATVVPAGVMQSPNLIYSTANPANLPPGTTAPYQWSGFIVTTSTGGGVSGGNQPGYNTSTGTFMLGYTQSTIAYTYAFSQALRNSGMSITGYNYAFQYFNQDYSRGNLSASLNFAGTNGQSLYSKNWALGPTTEWTTVSGTETFTNSLLASNIANFSLSLSGKDDRFWAGYYGPQIKAPNLSLNYTFDQCSANPLSSPSCPGYQAAYTTQQCNTNPLYSPSCPGYQAAYTTQQCSANPLYATSCPGYQAAYLTAQCTNNPLYSSACPGYQQAYHDQQCTVNPLYATDCPGYQQAYLNAQCIKDSLYSRLCSGYNTAYAIKYLVPNIDSSAVNQSLSGTAAVAASNPTSVNTNGTVSTTPSSTGNSTVDSVISTPSTTSTTSSTSVSPAATNSVITPQAPAGSAMSSAMSGPPQGGGNQGGEQPQQANNQPQSNRKEQPQSKENQQEKQKEAVAANKGAKSMDEQKATQGALIASMGAVPGFDAYSNVIIRDSLLYKPYSVYNNQVTIDNRRASRGLFGPSDSKFNEIIDSQYKQGN